MRMPYYSATEWTLITTGLCTAAGSAAFAVMMVASADRPPAFNGGEHLLLFAQPATTPSAYVPRVALAKRFREVDFTPTGSLDAQAPALTGGPGPRPFDRQNDPGLAAKPGAVLTEYTLYGVADDTAFVMGPMGLEIVKVGSVLQNGQLLVDKIELKDNKWAVFTSKGKIIPLR